MAQEMPGMDCDVQDGSNEAAAAAGRDIDCVRLCAGGCGAVLLAATSHVYSGCWAGRGGAQHELRGAGLVDLWSCV
jgi:hypothetical protein